MILKEQTEKEFSSTTTGIQYVKEKKRGKVLLAIVTSFSLYKGIKKIKKKKAGK